jgi:hypothetical protein
VTGTMLPTLQTPLTPHLSCLGHDWPAADAVIEPALRKATGLPPLHITPTGTSSSALAVHRPAVNSLIRREGHVVGDGISPDGQLALPGRPIPPSDLATRANQDRTSGTNPVAGAEYANGRLALK